MKAAVLDKNVCSKKFAKKCSARTDTILLAKSIRDADDPDVMKEAIRLQRILVTNDLDFVTDNADSIPDLHPGVVIVDGEFSVFKQTMTWRIAEAVLDLFKTRFAEWHAAPCDNSIITITTSRIQVRHMEAGDAIIDCDESCENDQWPEGWQERIADALRGNAAAN